MTQRRKTAYAFAALIAVVVILYSHVFQCDFVVFDDNSHVLENPYVIHGLTLRDIAGAFTHFIASQWIPLSWMSHMLDVTLFGFSPGWHHLVNLLFHALNACLVFEAFRRLARPASAEAAFWPALAVAALFAVHPVNVESVAWIAERKNVLSTFFWLLAMFAYARFVAAPPAPGVAWRARWMLATAGCMALGLMAKPMLVTLPYALLILDFWPLRRHETTRLWLLIREKALLFLLSAAASLLALSAAAQTGHLFNTVSLSLAARAGNALTGYARYLGLLFWPSDLAVLYPLRRHIPALQIAEAVALLLALTLVFWHLRKRQPWLLAGWLWFAGTLVPVSGIFQIGPQALADRFAYVPALGLFWAVAWSLRELPKPLARCLPAVSMAVLVLLSALTLRQVGYWTDTVTLFDHTLSVTEPNGIAFANAGLGRMGRGEYSEAVKYLRASAALIPTSSDIRAQLGESLMRAGSPEAALTELKRSLELDKRNRQARHCLLLILAKQGRFEEAARLIPASAKEPPPRER